MDGGQLQAEVRIHQDALAGHSEAGQAGTVASAETLGDEDLDGAADHLDVRIAEEGLGSGVPEDDPAGVDVADDHRLMDAPEQSADPEVLWL